MKALQFSVSIPRYLFGLALGPLYRSAYYGPFSCLQYRDVPEPELLGPDWVKVKTRYGGICGTDLNLIQLRTSTLLSPFASQRFTMGHEQVGAIVELGEEVEGFELGQRVVVDPVLPCPVRSIDPPCAHCRAGEWSRCENFAGGSISPGVLLGSCADTGGSWSPYFLAHRFQLFALPDEISDENALLIEPFTTALHAVSRCLPEDGDTVLVIGAGTIGICAVAALRCLDSQAHVIVLAKYPFQGQLAERYGADDVIYLRDGDHYQAVAQATGGRLYKPIMGERMMIGGADVVYDCVGNDGSLDDALRFVRAGGSLAVVGTIGQTKKVDWTPLWFQELKVTGTNCACALEEHEGERLRTFEWTIRWMAEEKLDLSPLLTHRFPLADYRRALAVAMNKGRNRAVKVAFGFD
ncbi:MAG: zinc-binding dehydrogenase [Chloroflexota bacterium]|nr:zinc-binding dehydrogenase [Chloroflexota bacterium]